jgi:hypothetical protein
MRRRFAGSGALRGVRPTVSRCSVGRWPRIHEALGSDAARVLPPLLALRAVTVRLPEYIVLTLESIAAEDRTTLDAALHFELTELAGTHLTRLESAIPGYREAYFFPSPCPRGAY